VTQFGKERVINTPICESAVVSEWDYLLMVTKRLLKCSLLILFRQDSIHCEFISQIALSMVRKSRCCSTNALWRWNAKGPFHSQTNEAWFTKPGLKVVYPAFPYDAKVC
jgi:2-oxoisovalerate dehydrogenase E1 component